MNTAKEKALEIIHKQGGIIRTQEAFQLGIHRRTLYGLRDEGALFLLRGVSFTWQTVRTACLPKSTWST